MKFSHRANNRLLVERFLVPMSGGRRVNRIEYFRVFPQSFQANAERMPRFSHDHFFPYCFNYLSITTVLGSINSRLNLF
jgi:hypothetical protein